jgi:hypothetical protein
MQTQAGKKILCLCRSNQEKRPRWPRFLPMHMPNVMESVRRTKTGRKTNQIFSGMERGAL